jgi:hypothetical protein
MAGKKFIFYVLQKYFFSCHQFNLCSCYEGDPLSPPKGEATQEEAPLTPPLSRYFHQPYGGYRILGDALAVGAEARGAEAPKSDY